MTRAVRSLLRRGWNLSGLLLSAVLLAPVAASGQSAKFITPTKEELAMTSLPGYPNAATVVLYREQVTSDDAHATYYYDRINILTEEGKKYANVELPYIAYQGQWGWEGNNKDIGDISGRTIHPDGTIVPFTGKPYVKTIEKDTIDQGTVKVQSLVFTLPDVQVGSLIEYRYASRINEDFYDIP